MKKKISIFISLFCASGLFAQQVSLRDSLQEKSTEIISKKPFFQRDGVQMAIAPTLLFAASAATWGERENIREIRNRYIPNFSVHYDDYLQYAPVVAVYGLKLAGVKGRNKIGRATLSYAASMLIMGVLVNSIKYTAKVERPDGSSNNSFPSGHTANAFTSATFLHKEYGLVNPLYSIGAYSMATFTGLGRNLNNRHWISDVLAGAGIGILSVELGYFFIDKFYKNKGDNLGILSDIEGNGNPSFLALRVGPAYATTNFLKESALDDEKEKGFEAGLEGAYFFNKHWGVGGNFSFSSFPIKPVHLVYDDPILKTIDVNTQSLGFLNFAAGPYYAYDFSDKAQLMLKSLVGYTHGAAGKVMVQGEIIDAPNNELLVAQYKPSSSILWINGASFTYKIGKELGLTFYTDYSIANSKITYKFSDEIKNEDDKNQDFNDAKIKEKVRYFTLGLKLTAYF